MKKYFNYFFLVFSLFLMGLFYYGCSDTHGNTAKLYISTPENGTTLTSDDDTDTDIVGLNYDIMVGTENLENGTIITLESSSGTKVTREFTGSNPVAFRDFNIGTVDGNYTLRAYIAGTNITSEEIVVQIQLEVVCPAVEFTHPVDGSTLACDQDENSEEEGFQYTFNISTDAETGQEIVLYIDGAATKTLTVTGPTVSFEQITIPGDSNQHTYTVGFPDLPTCSSLIRMTVDCNLPECNIIDPASDVNVLNQEMDDYPDDPGLQMDVVVESPGIEEGSSSELIVDGNSRFDQDLVNEEATFLDVEINEGRDRTLQARCIDTAGNVGVSPVRLFTVDVSGPPLSIIAVHTLRGDRSVPLKNTVFNQDDDLYDSRDYMQIGLFVQSDETGNNLEVVSIEDGNPSTDEDGTITYNNEAAENMVVVTCHDGIRQIGARIADNYSNITEAVLNINCASGRPIVSIVDPLSSDLIIMADDTDNDPVNGLHYNVTACTDTNNTATLLVNGEEAASVAAVQQTCQLPNGESLPYTLNFTNVQIAAWREEGNPQIKVRILNSAGATGESPTVTPTVDNSPPILSMVFPTCGLTINPAEDPDPDPDTTDRYEYPDFWMTLTDVTGDVTINVLDGNNTTGYSITTTAINFIGLEDFWLSFGENHICASASDVHGNIEDTCSPPPPDDCVISVIDMPLIEIKSPPDGSSFSKANDPDSQTPEFELPVVVWTDQPVGSTITLNDGTQNIILDSTATSDSRGGSEAIFNLSLAEGDYILTASVSSETSTSEAVSNIRIDLNAPEDITDLDAVIANRRESSITLSWTSPQDPVFETVDRYEIRWSNSPITDENLFNSANVYQWNGQVLTPGSTQTITLRYLDIEKDYYFAVRAVDRAGQTSSIANTADPVHPGFQSVTLSGTGGEYMGMSFATGDFNDDNIPDVAVGAPGSFTGTRGNHVYILFGHTNSTQAPDKTIDVTLTGNSGDFFGWDIASLDWNGDGIDDLAVTAWGAIGEGAGGVAYNGYVAIFYGKENTDPWPSNVNVSSADVIIRYNTGTSGVMTGFYIANLGHFNDDAFDDLLVTVPSANNGEAFVVLGRDSTDPSISDKKIVLNTAETDLKIISSQLTYRFGTDSAGIGDIDNDDFDDSVICDYLASSQGICYIIKGRSLTIGANQSLSVSSLSSSDIIQSPVSQNSMGFGRRVKAIGDINNDTYEDIAISAPFYDSAYGSNSGIIYIYFGNSTGINNSNPMIIETGANWSSPAADDRIGISLARSFDLNTSTGMSINTGTVNANLPDILFVSYKEGDSYGHVRAFYGSQSYTSGTTVNAENSSLNIIPDINLGLAELDSIGLLKDLNGDTYLEIIASDISNNSNSGLVVLYY